METQYLRFHFGLPGNNCTKDGKHKESAAFSGQTIRLLRVLNTFNVPLTVEPFSTYLNFKLSVDQVSQISKYIKKYSSNLTLTPIKMFPGSLPEYIISVNIYNCTSPIFLNDEKKIVRCEINTYVKDEQNDKGTMIIDYLSNEISMDPLNIFKNKNNISFHKEDNYNYIKCISKNEKIKLDYWMESLNIKG